VLGTILQYLLIPTIIKICDINIIFTRTSSRYPHTHIHSLTHTLTHACARAHTQTIPNPTQTHRHTRTHTERERERERERVGGSERENIIISINVAPKTYCQHLVKTTALVSDSVNVLYNTYFV